jgi:hypothetical protein
VSLGRLAQREIARLLVVSVVVAGCGDESSPASISTSKLLPGGGTTNQRLLGPNASIAPATNITVEHEKMFFSGNSFFNHYSLVSLLALIVALVSAEPGRAARVGWYWFLCGQIAVVYVFAGLAKLNADWLLHGEPLHTWLQASVDVPLIGRTFALREVAVAMSAFDAVFDLFIVAFLLCPRTRSIAFAVAVIFHSAIGLLFPVGIFSALMIISLTVFF